MRKIRPSHKFTYLTFFILFVVLTFLLWGIFGTKSWTFKGDYVKERLWVDLTYSLISFALCVAGALIYRAKTYYMVNNEVIIRHGKKINEIHLKDIVYLDEEYSLHHSEMLIYVNTHKWINLTLDPKRELIKIVKDNSPLLNKDELNFRYPESLNKKK